MARKKKKVLEEVLIIDAGAEGKAVAKVDEQVLFVTGAVPGDIVDVLVLRKKKRFLEGRPLKFHKYSEKRIKPICEYFGTCGGCKWQNLSYEDQLHYKWKQVNDNLTRIGKVELPEIMPIVPSATTEFYRNKLEFTFSNKRWLTKEEIDNNDELERNALGFHIPGMFDKIVDIDKCHLQGSISNDIRNWSRAYALENGLTFFDIREQVGLLRTLMIRTSSTGDIMVVMAYFDPEHDLINKMMDAMHEAFPAITSVMKVHNFKKNDSISDLDIVCHAGNDHIMEEMEGLSFKIGPKSFYQTNSAQAYELYKITRDFAGITDQDLVYDLYTGTGTIANFVAKTAKKVVGVEYVPEAIEDAFVNSGLNKIENTDFYAGDMKDVLNNDFIAKNGTPDVIITDPPRAGMHESVVEKIIEIGARKVVYVSCNPATQARDLQLMDETYKVTKVQPVDMFPHTHHVENVVLLEKR